MPTDAPPVGSPRWWLARLEATWNVNLGRGVIVGKPTAAQRREYDVSNRSLQTLQDYLDGKHRLQFMSPEFAAAFGGLFRDYSDNFMPLVRDATNDRLYVEGFRFGSLDDVTNRAGEAESADLEAWTIWQRNQLDVFSNEAHRDALGLGCSAAIVWYDPDDPALARITFESPFELVWEYQPGTRRLAAAGKFWADEWTGQRMATIYLPDAIYKFQTRKSSAGGYTTSRWDPRRGDEEAVVANPLGRVPVVPIENEADLRGRARSDITQLIPVQDAINFYQVAMMVAGEFAGFRQRWATGIEIPKDPETKQPLETFAASVKHLWTSSSKDAKFGDFETTDLGNYARAIEVGVQHLATRSSTPPHYLYQMAQIPSGESIKSAEAGLVAKSMRKTRRIGQAHEDILRLALAVEGNALALAPAAETIWRDVEYRTEGEHVDALLKLKALGVPQEFLWERAGFTPPQIARMKAMGADPGPQEEPVVDDDLPAADGAAAIAAVS